MLHRGGQVAVTDIFDTMIAARLCGYQELGLAALVARHFGVKLSKASQKANWALRPLSNQMIEYALNDTKYLLPLAEILETELRRLKRWDWFAESCNRMLASAREPRERDEGKAWRIPGSAALRPRAQSVLRVLWHWRDAEARGWDRPPFHVMSNEDILRIAEKAVNGEAFSTPRMSNRRRKSFEIILALALHIPEGEWPAPTREGRRRPSREQAERFEQLKNTRDKIAADLGLDSSIVAPRGALEAASIDPRTPCLCVGRSNCSTSTIRQRLSMRPDADLVSLALAEDIGAGDVTTRYFTDPNLSSSAKIVAREACIVAGLNVVEEVFRRVDAELWTRKLLEDGARMQPADVAMELRGRAASLLTAERTALNFLQRLSGVATLAEQVCGGSWGHLRENS